MEGNTTPPPPRAQESTEPTSTPRKSLWQEQEVVEEEEPKGKRVVGADRHPAARGFEFDMDQGGYLLVVFRREGNERVPVDKIQVRDIYHARDVMARQSSKDYALFSTYDMFGGPAKLRCIDGSMRNRSVVVTVRVEHKDPVVAETFWPCAFTMVVDTGATSTCIFIARDAFDAMRKLRAPEFFDSACTASGDMIDTLVMPIDVSIGDRVVSLENALMSPVPKDKEKKKKVQSLLGMDCLEQCHFVFAAGEFSLVPLMKR